MDAESAEPLIVVDGANVVGSVPDGWWRDRRGAATRLRDALAARDVSTLPAVLLGAVTLVVEGAARGVPPVAGVHVEAAPQSGDDHIVALVADNVVRRPVVVVTADRELRQRVRELGASIVSPGELRASIPYGGRRDST
ncbi:hypothetical protein ACFPIJ_20195 [Dactylosporangium cerinum]|uniref:NTP pyrophosphohydrolase n=1 Tax=Dactylosporangium cerinum TaxID=1434730 RepID=A0ABV9VUP8_9ACTN